MSIVHMCFAQRSAAFILSCSLVLGGCGGGGGAESAALAGGTNAGTTAATTATPVPVAEAPKVAARVFTDIQVPAGFTWSTVSEAAQARVTVRRADGSTAALRLTISNFIETDPTGSGAPIEPMSTDVILSALSRPAGAATVVEFGPLRLPAGTAQVLVEVFAVDGSARLAWRKTTPAELAAGSLELPI